MTGVSGVGSLPGTDFPAALRLVLDALGGADGGLPHPCPSYPLGAPWAGMIGRAAGLLVDLPVSLDAGTWRLSDTAGIDGRRARTTLRDDLDMLQEQAHEWRGPFKVQVTGPWTLAASVLRPLGGLVLADRGARRDLAQSLAQGTADLLAELAARLPQADLVLQVDEPALPSVLAGAVPTEEKLLPAPQHRSPGGGRGARPAGRDHPRLGAALLRRRPGAAAGRSGRLRWRPSLDQTTVRDWDGVAEFVDAGRTLHLGCLPTTSERLWSPDELVDRVLRVLRPLELADLPDRLGC